ncbi:D-glycero-alpha-D-manno-heptose-1,7-bisphosphate 7-phosphatase [Alkalibacterium olivapovliticus]|uniref:D,D-heptose 1,7-bisphosphate phosphatase n=1 Tax=Alkalibacterium olivapovliticus TaxID=99907 RepID=A0A2T0WA47_9LACT|nr:HAD-IIIA family hydrolase [Alkalibacterium olivapovliticus]PRY83595.1 D-glycero-D-manno-heptose 1,7-bisphosphate phosphatase [Alkalibacterium olivapovliticus]
MKVIFLDRDGTMGGNGGGVAPDKFQLFKQTIPAIRLLNQNGYVVMIVTNQSRISRGYFTEEEFIKETNKLLSVLKENKAEIKDYFYCPHYNEECKCHKPDIGMIQEAYSRYPSINFQQSYFIGDNGSSDMMCAQNAGIKKILVKTGWGVSSLTTHRHLWKDIEPDKVVKNISEAAEWIVQNEKFNR